MLRQLREEDPTSFFLDKKRRGKVRVDKGY